jgi:hypothetical protein
VSDDPGALLAHLHRSKGAGSIEGVEFDFRHDEIEDGWEPIHPLCKYTGGNRLAIWPYNRSPALVLPWSKPVSRRYARHRKTLHGQSLLRDLALYGPHGVVKAGDRLSVLSVVPHWYGDEFDAPADALILRVRYQIVRPDGSIVRVKSYSNYVHRDSHWVNRVELGRAIGGMSVGVVRARLSAILKAGDVNDHGQPTPQCEVSAANCLDAVALLEAEVEAEKISGSRGPMTEGVRERYLIEAGFYLAKAEAAVLMYPAAVIGLSAVEGGGIGGAISAENRRVWREEHWEPEALKLAVRRRNEVPQISQRNLASDIQNGWTLEGDIPGFDWLLELVRRAEKAHQLAPRISKSALANRGR